MALSLPGYRFDTALNKYFKLQPGELAIAPAATASKKRAKKIEAARLTKGKGRATVQDHQPTSLFRHRFEQRVSPFHSERNRHDIDSIAFSRLGSASTISPDCLTVDESIVKLCIDGDTIRIGGSNGSIASGSLSRSKKEDSYYPHHEFGWRTGYYFPAEITSLSTCGDRMLATCLGPPAQALFATTSESITLASVTLSPRKTSLWSSAFSPTFAALGCDSKVILSIDPTRRDVDAYVTGDRFGGGAVFALDVHEDLVFAGTRNSRVLIFDQRSSRTRAADDPIKTAPELSVGISSAVTHLRRTRYGGVVVAGMDGSLAMYDTRNLTTPTLKMTGHVNSYSRNLGFDVWDDEFVALAGQDARIRMWSLRSGKQLESTASSSTTLTQSAVNPLHRFFFDPVRALQFMDSPCSTTGPHMDRKTLESIDSISSRLAADVTMWVADGPTLESFSVNGIPRRE